MAQETETKHPFDIFYSRFGVVRAPSPPASSLPLMQAPGIHWLIEVTVATDKTALESLTIKVTDPMYEHEWVVEKLRVVAVPLSDGRFILMAELLRPKLEPVCALTWKALSDHLPSTTMNVCALMLDIAAGDKFFGDLPVTMLPEKV